MSDFTFDGVRYLTSKKTVDDRALNRAVWHSFTDAIAQFSGDRLTVAELGAGTGSMLERLLDWQFFAHLDPACTAVALDLIDNDGPALERARLHVPALAQACGWACAEIPDGWQLQQASMHVDVRFRIEDVRQLVAETAGGEYDILIAHAFLDLFHLPSFVPSMLKTLGPDGLFYFTMNYDGATIFEPVTDRSLENTLQASYNSTMDRRITAGQPSGDSLAGRHLYHVLTGCGASVMNMGSSDWVVFPRSGGYGVDEEYFLRCILWLVEQALRANTDLPIGSVEEWLRQRSDQVEARELIYIAHQLDIVGRVG